MTNKQAGALAFSLTLFFADQTGLSSFTQHAYTQPSTHTRTRTYAMVAKRILTD